MEIKAAEKPLATKGALEKHSQAFGLQPMRRIMPSQVQLGFLDTSPEPLGKYKHFWIMRLRRIPGRNRLPRGFTSSQQFV